MIDQKKKKINTPLQPAISKKKKSSKQRSKSRIGEFITTGIQGFDELLGKGIPKGTSILIAGGAGSGKTIFCLQTMAHALAQGEKCLYLSFEESEKRLKEHMDGFGWDWKKYENKAQLKIIRKDPYSLTTSIEALLAKAKGELLIDINEILNILPPHFAPTIIFIDSLTAVAAAFGKKEDSYRIFIEQFFRYLESNETTTFLISETDLIPIRYSREGVEEFLADGVIVLYTLKQRNSRENAIEVLKLRGVKHLKKIVAMEITDKGIIIYPDQEVLEDLK